MMNFSDGGILGDEFHLLMPEFRYITAEQDGSGAFAQMADGNCPERNRHSSGIDVCAPRRPARDHHGERLIYDNLAGQNTRRHLGKRLALQLIGKTNAVESGKSIGAGKQREAIGIETDQAVVGPRCATAGGGGGIQVWEVPRGDHVKKVARARIERELLTTRRAVLRQVCVECDDSNGARLHLLRVRTHTANNGNGSHPSRSLFVPSRGRRFDNSSRREGLVNLGTPFRFDFLPDKVAIKKGRGAGGASVRDGNETTIIGRSPQHDVSKSEVCDELPVADKHMEPLDIRGAGDALSIHNVAEC